MTDLVDCGECRTQGCPAGKCRNRPQEPGTAPERAAFKEMRDYATKLGYVVATAEDLWAVVCDHPEYPWPWRLAAPPAGPTNEPVVTALRELVEAVTVEVNEKGAGGYLLARLTDARATLAAVPVPSETPCK